jgi:quercetin dioxygenase-like cupin family protein
MRDALHRRTLGAAALAGVIGLAVGFAGGLAGAEVAYPPVKVLVQSGETVIGQPIVYPPGKPQVTAAIVTMPPGDVTGWHKHEAPVVGYMLGGEISVDYGADGTRVYRAGDAFLEALNSEHNGTNTGTEPAQVLMVVIGAEGLPLSTPQE